MHKKLLFATINRRLTFCDACAQLGISEEDVYDKSNGEKEEKEVGEIKGDSLKLQTDKKKTLLLMMKEMVKCLSKENLIVQMMKKNLRTEKVMINKTMIGL